MSESTSSRPPPRKVSARRRVRPQWIALVAAIVAAGGGVFAFNAWQTRFRLPKLEIKGRTNRHWMNEGYVQMVSPIRPPSAVDGSHDIQVWVKFPAQGKVTVRNLKEQGRNVLVFPPGTIADRIEFVAKGGPQLVVDVRGTELTQSGELFHVYRRKGTDLQGFVWPRGDSAAQLDADYDLKKLVMANEKPTAKSFQGSLTNNQCAPCHGHDRAPNVKHRRGQPNRGTDGSGFFVPQTVLEDEAPVEYHRDREMNVDDKFVKFKCKGEKDGDDTPAEIVTNAKKRNMRWPSCPASTVPIAVLDLTAALAEKDEHAQKVCASRRALHEHMDAKAREAFADAFRKCGIGEHAEAPKPSSSGG